MGQIKYKSRKNSVVGIYSITSPSGRIYIGQSWDIKQRWFGHKKISKRGCPLLNNSFKKYGTDKHLFKIICELPPDISQEILDQYEIIYINQYKEVGFRLLNLKSGGYNAKLPEYLRKKISDLHKGNKYSVGRAMTTATRVALQKANIGRKMPESVRVKFAASASENGRLTGYKNRGKIRTLENKKKISETLKKRIENKGELHPTSKFTNEIILEIRAKYKPKKYTTTDIARDYKMSRTNAKDIIARRIWTHI